MDTTTPTPDSTVPATLDVDEDRAFVKAMIDKLPMGTTLEQIEYHIGVALLLRERTRKVDEALAMGVEEATRRGLLHTQEQVEREVLSWRR